MVSEPFLAVFLCLNYTLPGLPNQVGDSYPSFTAVILKNRDCGDELDDCCIGIIKHRYL